jgi:hypothetical protein
MPFGPWPGGGGGAGGVVSSLAFNGGPALTGAIVIRSPMAADVAASPVRIDNGNMKALLEADPVVGIDVDLNNSFSLVLSANRTLSNPTASIIVTPMEGEKITFRFQQAGDSSNNTITFPGGLGGYRFAEAGAPAGITLQQYLDVQTAAQAANKQWKIGFEYIALDDRWDACALAGPYL